jgi:hypothetical protein
MVQRLAQAHDAGRKFVMDAPAGRAHPLRSIFLLCRPLPTGIPINGAAFRAGHTVDQLLLLLVRVADVILLRASGNAACPGLRRFSPAARIVGVE